MKIRIQYLKNTDIKQDYIDSLNSQNYMKFSRNAGEIHTVQNQLRYLENFDYSTSFILAIQDDSRECLVGTSTFYVDDVSRVINIGLLIFEKFSGQGIGTKALKEITNYIESIFPFHTLEIGTDSQHEAMIRIAKSNNFNFSHKFESKVYYRKENIFERLLQTLSERELIVICNDAGGAANIASMLKILNIQPEGIVTGPAISVFESLKVDYQDIDFCSDRFTEKLVVLGSSIYGGIESLALEDPRFANNVKIVVLDHWINYRDRFHKTGKFLPDHFWVTNILAYELASQLFNQTLVTLIPDSQLALLKRAYNLLEDSEDTLLLIWEYQTHSQESLKFPIGSLKSRIAQIEEFCRKKSIAKVIVRLHPSQNREDFESDIYLSQNNFQVEVSSNRGLETDLAKAKVVVGFSSAALYFASELGIPTYSFYKDSDNHWTNSFPKIEKFNG